ncbi:MAG: gliding motility-associated C-terminal domain-containing protein [Bacteroidota bacterium]
MNKFQLHRFIGFIALSFSLTGILNPIVAQDIIVPISDEGLVESTNCDNAIFITDDNGGVDGNYLPDQDYQITACFNTLVGDSIQIVVVPEFNNNDTINQWQVDGMSTLFVYEGNFDGTTPDPGALLGAFNTETHPDGFFLTTTVPCITLVWESGENSSFPGFIAQLNCLQNLQPFGVQVLIEDFGLYQGEIEGINPDDNVVAFCVGDTLNFTANPFFPLSDAVGDGYEQLPEECIYSWDMGNGDVFEDVGLNTLEYSYTESGGYLATLTITDIMGQVETYTAFLLQATRPLFSNDILANNLCLGDTTIITGGITTIDTVGVDPTTSAVLPNYDFTDSRFLPDGNGELYTTLIEIEGFTDDPTIEDMEDFLGVCIIMEHTFLGDLEAWLTCPNGQSALLFDGYNGVGLYEDGQEGFGGGGTYLGDANDDESSDPGIGFEYCFSDNGPLGTLENEFNAGNTVPVNSFEGGGNAMIAGSYLPAENFATSFEGCPVNGEWTLNIADNIGIDNGWIFEWSMEFNPEFEVDTVFYTPALDSAYWEVNPDIIEYSDTSVTIVPQSTGTNQYTFVVIDEFGCLHSETYDIFVREIPEISAVPVCSLIDSIFPTNAPEGGLIEVSVIQAPLVSDTLTFANPSDDGWYLGTATDYGIFEVTFTEQFCGLENEVSIYSDTIIMDFRPPPNPILAFPDTILCEGASIFLDAGTPEANSGNYEITWSNGVDDLGDETTYQLTVDSPGDYVLTVNEPACPEEAVTVSTDVDALEYNIIGDSLLCDDTFTNLRAAIFPPPERASFINWDIGGLFSTDTEGSPITVTNNGNYGNFPITITDLRCPEDSHTEDHRWVQQPELTILPDNPEICYEFDTLSLTAVLEGNSGGTYFWEISAVTTPPAGVEIEVPSIDIDSDNIQEFPPLSTSPNITYVIAALTFDEFDACPTPGADEMFFTPLACEYVIPNVVTPNGDGRNDIFDIIGAEDFPGAALAIFNRWGQEVFSSSAYDEYQRVNTGWDPEDLPGGVYVYELKLPSIDVVETGNLTIITETGSSGN